jgi:nucleoside-diphosphate-sugar epimerase
MRVFVAGASGAIGTRLVPQLIENGHEVVGTVKTPGKAERVRAVGAEPVVLDLLDAGAVRKAVLDARPDAIVHEATALADATWGRNFDKVFAGTNALRTKGTDALLAAAREAGVRRFVAQSFASYRYVREGGEVKTEDDPLDPDPPANARKGWAAMEHLDRAVVGAGGISLRYGLFYGAANDGPGARARRPGDLQRRRRRPGAGARVAAGPGPGARRKAAAALPCLAGAAGRRRGRGRDGHHCPRRLQREGQARARLGPALPELAVRLLGGVREPEAPEGGTDRRTCARVGSG